MEAALNTPANYLDIKLHGIINLPSSFVCADSGAAPMYAEHPFRYDVTVEGLPGPSGLSFSNGRILQCIPLYTSFVDDAELPAETVEEVVEDVPCVPGEGPAPPPGVARADADAYVPCDLPSAILFALTADAEAVEMREEPPIPAKKDRGPKRGQQAAPPPVESVKPLRPLKDQPPPCCLRIPLGSATLAAIEALMEAGSPLTLRLTRRLKANAPAEWEDLQEPRFQALIRVPLNPLLNPGATEFKAEVQLDPVEPEVKEEERGKKKAQPKKTKTNVPALLTDEPDLGDAHPYVVSNTTAVFSVRCSTSLARLPKDRPMPTLQPSDLIPRRVRPARRPLEASKQYTRSVASLAERIVAQYREHVREVDLEGEEARSSFLTYLHSSGHTTAYQQLLAPIVTAVVRERFVRKVAPSKVELETIVNELYSYLLEQLHVAMDHAFGKPAVDVSSAALDGDDDGRWRRLAIEAEEMEDFPFAVRCYQERLAQADGDDSVLGAWIEYAEFALRARDILRAEQAYREALSIDPSRFTALLGYGLLLLSRSRLSEAEVFLQTAADVEPSVEGWAAVALLYDVLQLSASDSGSEDAPRAYSRESKKCVAEAIRVGGEGFKPEDVYVTLSKHLVSLRLEDLANLALAKADPSSFAVDLLYAQLFMHTEQYDEAIRILAARLSSGTCDGVQDCEARLLLGDIQARAGKVLEAEASFDIALRIDPNAASSSSLLRLGNLYLGLGKYKDALSALLLAAQRWPCGLTWLGAGIAYYRLDDMARAEQALNESNIHNNLNPKTWGYLSLMCVRQRREDDAEMAYNQAVKLGLSDPGLIAELGTAYFRAGRFAISEASFRKALEFNDDPNIHMHLARTLAAMKNNTEARTEYEHLLRHGKNEFQQAKAAEQLELLP